MDGFKPTIKMKAGGSVTKAIEAYEKKEERAESGMHEDVKQDKKLIKKAINLHDDQLHEGKKTDLKTLKKGGRCKREGGTVTKYKSGGCVKKMADGSLTGPLAATNQLVGVPATPTQNAAAADMLKRKLMAAAAAKGRGMGAGMGGPAAAAPTAPVGQPQAQNIAATPQNIGATTGPIMKKGGKVKKGCK